MVLTDSDDDVVNDNEYDVFGAVWESSTTTFTWDVAQGIPQVLDDGDLRYIYGLGRIAQVDDSEVTHYYLSDALGSTMALTDASKGVVNTYEYDVFGAVSASSGSLANFFEFAGEQVDDSTDLQYLRARYYDPATGRFLGRDPLNSSPAWPGHGYAYVNNRPVLYGDPSGLWCPWSPTDCSFISDDGYPETGHWCTLLWS